MGCHVSTAGGLCTAIERAVATGCEAFQIFVRNPRSWQVRPLERGITRRFREERKRAGLGPLVVHTAYLINLSSPDEVIFGKSLALFKTELELAEDIGADFLVTHLGTPKGRGRAYAMGRIREALEEVGKTRRGRRRRRKGTKGAKGAKWENTGGTAILFENSAHRGMTGAELDELGEVIGIARSLGIGAGMCFDTCHGFAAGYPFIGRGAIKRLADIIYRAAGPGGLRLIHLNDSKGEASSGVDHHEDIGRGRIGRRRLSAFLREADIAGVPVILETPKEREGDDIRNLRVARRLIGVGPMRVRSVPEKARKRQGGA